MLQNEMDSLRSSNKIFETLIFGRIYDFFAEHKLFSDNQCGYLRNRSTSQAVLKLVNHALPAITEKKYSIIIMIDWTKAFDCVCHKMLLAKLHRYGFRERENIYYKFH